MRVLCIVAIGTCVALSTTLKKDTTAGAYVFRLRDFTQKVLLRSLPNIIEEDHGNTLIVFGDVGHFAKQNDLGAKAPTAGINRANAWPLSARVIHRK